MAMASVLVRSSRKMRCPVRLKPILDSPSLQELALAVLKRDQQGDVGGGELLAAAPLGLRPIGSFDASQLDLHLAVIMR